MRVFTAIVFTVLFASFVPTPAKSTECYFDAYYGREVAWSGTIVGDMQELKGYGVFSFIPDFCDESASPLGVEAKLDDFVSSRSNCRDGHTVDVKGTVYEGDIFEFESDWIKGVEVSCKASNRASEICARVSATAEWQTVNFDTPVSVVTRIEGGWTVDRVNYAAVGPQGHTGEAANRLAPYEQYKFNRDLPFGALLISLSGGRSSNLLAGVQLHALVNSVALRINDRALGDNEGALNVCFGPS
jgi:hypothetical protein